MSWVVLGYALTKLDEQLADPQEHEHVRSQRFALPEAEVAMHRTEDGYKQRYVPNQGWVEVAPTSAIQVTVRFLQPITTTPRDYERVVLAASVHKDVSTIGAPFNVAILACDTTEDVESTIWRMLKINDSHVAIQLLGSDGVPLPAGKVVLKSLPTVSYIVTLSFSRWSTGNEVVLAASTLGDAVEVSVEAGALTEHVAARIHDERGLAVDMNVKLLRSDGLPLSMGKPVMNFLCPDLGFIEASSFAAQCTS